ncbi:MAG: InlB B-repeat-containing protein [Clostridia bacterium]|nr:InlB B-repeat-containing protein [Clostridia bacterium]
MKNISKISKLALVFLSILLLATLLLACGEVGNKEAQITVIDPVDSGDEFTSTVEFNANGGFFSDSSSTKTVTVKTGEKVSAPSVSRDKYQLVGWKRDDSLDIFDFSTPIDENIMLVAQWKLNNVIDILGTEFTVDDRTNTISFNLSNTTTSLVLTNKVLLQGNNWSYQLFYDEGCSLPVAEANICNLTDLSEGTNTYYLAIFTNSSISKKYKVLVNREAQCTVTFVGIDDKVLSTQMVIKGNLIAEPDYTLETLKIVWREYYDESNTYSNANWDFSKDKVNHDVILHAISDIKTFIPVLDPQGGVISGAIPSIVYYSPFELPVPVKEGYTFIGWFDDDNTQVTNERGVSLQNWTYYENISLEAKYSPRNLNLNAFVLVDGVRQNDKTRMMNVPYGEGKSITTNINNKYLPGNNGKLYIFAGWYIDGNLVSMDRNFVVDSMTDNIIVFERWYTATINSYLQGELDNTFDVTISIESNNFNLYGNVNSGEQIVITGRSQSSYSFIEWRIKEGENDLNRDNESTIINLTNNTYIFNTYWTVYKIKSEIYVDGVLTETNDLDDNVLGFGNCILNKEIELSTLSDEDYCFIRFEYQVNEQDIVDYNSSFNITPTATMFDAENDYSFVIKLYYISLSGDYRITKVNSYGESEFVFVGRRWYEYDGTKVIIYNYSFTLNSILDEKMIDKISVYTDPDVVTNDTDPDIFGINNIVSCITYEKNNQSETKYKNKIEVIGGESTINISSSFYNAGSVKYTVNDSGEQLYASVYGEDSSFVGLTSLDKVQLKCEPFNDYVFLGWFDKKTGENVSYDYVIDVDVPSERIEYVCAYIPLYYEIDIHQGTYSVITDTITYPKHRNYYEFVNDEVNGIRKFVKTEDEDAVPQKVYYSYGETTNNTTTGVQTVTYNIYNDANFQYTMTTTVKNGYIFEGWYNADGEWLSYDLSYTPNLFYYSPYYVAKFSPITDDYAIKCSIFDGQENSHYGSYGSYGYKLGDEEGKYSEKCVLTIATEKNRFDGENYYGYYYYGLFHDVDLESIDTNLSMEELYEVYKERRVVTDLDYIDDMILLDGYFKIGYVIDVDKVGSNKFFGIWKSTNYRERLDIDVHDESSTINYDIAGDIHYVYYQEQDGPRVILHVKQNQGFEFLGWFKKGTNEYLSNQLVYSIKVEDLSYDLYPSWSFVSTNLGVNVLVEPNIDIVQSEAYSYVATARNVTGGTYTKEVKFSAKNIDGYLFLGWFKDDILFIEKNDFILKLSVIPPQSLQQEETREYQLIIDGMSYEYNQITDNPTFALNPRWLKLESHIYTNADVYIKSYSYREIVDENTQKTNVVLKAYEDFNYDNEFVYAGYIFAGWFNSEGVKISSEPVFTYELNDQSINYESIIAKWIRNEIEIDISATGQGIPASAQLTHYEFREDSENQQYIVRLVAKKYDNFVFDGWKYIYYEVGNDIPYEEDISYQYEYEFVIPKSSVRRNQMKFVAHYSVVTGLGFSKTNMNADDGSTLLYGYRTDNTTLFTGVAEVVVNNGRIFEGWFSNGALTNADSRYIKYEGFTTTLEPRFSEFRNQNRVNSFDFSVYPKRYENGVKYYAYTKYDTTHLSGYSYVIRVEFDYINKLKVDFVRTDSSNNKVYYDTSKGYVEIEEKDIQGYSYQIIYSEIDSRLNLIGEISGLSIRRYGRLERYYGLVGSSVGQLVEIFLESNDAYEEFTHVGWFDNNETVVTNSKQLVINKPVKDVLYSSRYGKYVLSVDIDSQAKDYISISDADFYVRIEYNINNSTISAENEEVTMHIGDILKYNDKFIGEIWNGYIFGGWFKDEACKQEYNFEGPIYVDMVLYAKWIKVDDGIDINNTVTSNNIVFANGDDKKIVPTTMEQYVYFVAPYNGTLTVLSRNELTKKESILNIYGYTYYEVKMINFNDNYSYQISVEQGKVYKFGIRSKVADDSNNKFVLRLVLDKKVSTAKRIGVIKDLMDFSLESGSEKQGESVFAGWYNYRGELISERTEITDPNLIADEYNKFYVYNRTVDVAYKNIGSLSDEENEVRLYAKWLQFKATVYNTNPVAGSAVYSFEFDNDSLSPYYLSNYWSFKVTINDSANYTFKGWYLYDEDKHEYNESDPKYFLSNDETFNCYIYKDISVVAVWERITSGSSYDINYTIGENTPGEQLYNSPLNRRTIYENETQKVPLYAPTRVGDGYFYIFEGWYVAGQENVIITELDPSQIKSKVNLVAKWSSKPINNLDIYTDDDGSKYLYLGEYPQEFVRDTDGFDFQPATDGSGYYFNNNDENRTNRYMRVYFDNDFIFEGIEYKAKNELNEKIPYYFIVQKIRWNIVTDANYNTTLICDTILDLSVFNTSSNTFEGLINGESATIYLNNWEYSSIRQFINNTLLTTNYFSEYELNRLEMYKIRNANGYRSGDPTLVSVDDMPWLEQSNTNDSVYILSYTEIEGYSSYFSKIKVSDYAILKGCEYKVIDGENIVTKVITRSPGNSNNTIYMYDIFSEQEEESKKFSKIKYNVKMPLVLCMFMNTSNEQAR